MAEFKLALPTPATFVHGITGRDVETTILPVGTRYDFDDEPNPFQNQDEQTQFILVHTDDEALYRYRVRTADLNGIAI